MKVRIVSDLHIGGAAFSFKKPSKDEVLVIAGDTANNVSTMMDFVSDVSVQFKAVVVVGGNHEWYHGMPIDEGIPMIKEAFADLGNVRFLESDYVTIDDVTFIGGTLWTTFRGEDWVAMKDAKRRINDFSVIYPTEGQLITPEWMVKECKNQLHYIREACKKISGKKVIVTHFPLITEYQDPKYGTLRENPLNAYFINDFGHEIEDLEFDLAIAGHTHSAADFFKYGKRFIANPRGYCYRGKAENDKWDENFVVEL